MGLIDDKGGIVLTADDFDKGTALGSLNELIKAYCEHIWKTVDFVETAKLSAEADVLLKLCKARHAYFAE